MLAESAQDQAREGQDYRMRDNPRMLIAHCLSKRLALILALLAIAVPQAALAWNSAGHRLVAAMSWRLLSPEAVRALTPILARHPDYPRWLDRHEENPGYAAFLAAATWPDEIRRDPRFADAGDAAAPAGGTAFIDAARHRDWHYAEVDGSGQASGKGEADHQIARIATLLARPGASLAERSEALPWLIHLVADLHQPLHVGCRDDEGGNAFAIENPFNSRLPVTRLHTFWDDLPGPPWLSGKRLEMLADRLLQEVPRPPVIGSIARWQRESWQLACSQVYPGENGSLLPIVTADYLASARKLANTRLVAAAWRLAHTLETALVSRETDAASRATRLPLTNERTASHR